jgi:hypothetical protein
VRRMSSLAHIFPIFVRKVPQLTIPLPFPSLTTLHFRCHHPIAVRSEFAAIFNF